MLTQVLAVQPGLGVVHHAAEFETLLLSAAPWPGAPRGTSRRPRSRAAIHQVSQGRGTATSRQADRSYPTSNQRSLALVVDVDLKSPAFHHVLHGAGVGDGGPAPGAGVTKARQRG